MHAYGKATATTKKPQKLFSLSQVYVTKMQENVTSWGGWGNGIGEGYMGNKHKLGRDTTTAHDIKNLQTFQTIRKYSFVSIP